MRLIFALFIVLVFAPFKLAAQQNENDPLVAARMMATTAGSAKYCKIRDDIVEQYISNAYARLALLSRDEYEKVLSRLEFKNFLTATRVRAPEIGCEAFTKQFLDYMRQLP
ncbi:hypothetical protein [Kordiimonas sp. SCSIO 12610]|uniref:hypothetical protein n=1 Tax=Kordiimonas sp. SCSIO 12610 TaxID=2829597 RepID=UPI002108FCB1|nr:hypothetical protein [Kordiimonas sp. SCSIO 12610]UTW56655.1 hypothetical protein KFF44_07130 [Kordiimonas sp. SCSIO 12610]